MKTGQKLTLGGERCCPLPITSDSECRIDAGAIVPTWNGANACEPPP